MIEKTLGIVLKQIKYGESSLIVHLYTRNWGRLSILVPAARTSSRSKKAYLFQPLTLLELDVYHKPARDLQKIKEARNHYPLVHLTHDPVKSAIALFLADVLHKSLREETSNEELFDFLESHIQFLDIADQGVANFHLYFLLRLSRHLGFSPGIPPAREGVWFDLAHGVFTSAPPVHDYFLIPPLTTLMIELMSVQVSDLGSIKMDRNTRMDLLNGILRYYYLHLEGLGEIKSQEVLHSLFD